MKNFNVVFRTLIVFLCSFLSISAYSQSKFTLSGTVTDAASGEKLMGATISVKEATGSVISDNKGFYTMTLPQGTYTLAFSYLGFEKMTEQVNLTKDLTKDIRLISSTKTMDEVVVKGKAKDFNIKSTEVSVEKLSIQQIEKIPVIMGETDIFKTIQLLPGITSIAEGRSGFIVRGSGIDQNLILMDGMPLYYSSHMQSLYSVFNGDAVDGLTVYKGGIPARFGGHGASVLDVRMKESDFEQYHAKLSVGLITSKFSVEAPVIKDKLSVFLAGRSTKQSVGNLYDKMSGGYVAVSPTNGGKTGTVIAKPGTTTGQFTFFDPYESWYDLNGKVIYKINDNNSLFLSGYYGQDYAITDGGFTDWGNRASLLRWNHVFNPKFISNTSLIYSRYYTHSSSGIYEFNSGITTSGFKQEFSYFPNAKNEYRFGFQTEYQDFNHGALVD